MQDVAPVVSTPQRVGGMPLTLYVGADYCPFCASMRWPLVKSLSRFGSFTGLDERESTAGVDGFRSLATYDFNHATYTSQYVAFQTVETADANGNPLQQPTATQSSLINQFDPGGGIPFVFVAGRFVGGGFHTHRTCSRDAASSRSKLTPTAGIPIHSARRSTTRLM